MKLLLTSAGITNGPIKQSLLNLVGKPEAELKIAFVPTAAAPEGGDKEWLINDLYRIRQVAEYVDIIDIAQLTEAQWRPRIEFADVIFVGGGNTFYLSYWMQQSGLMAALPELLKTKVYAGISAGSMVVSTTLRTASQALAQNILKDDEYDELGPMGQSSAKTAQLVPFAVRPHLNSRFFPKITGERIQEIAKELAVSIYALDDQSAIQVVDGDVTVVSEGEWKLYE